MRWRGQLSSKFLLLGLSLLLLALVSIGMTMWVTRQLDGGAAAVNEAGRLRMQAWRLVSARQGERLVAAAVFTLYVGYLYVIDPLQPQRPAAVERFGARPA